MIRFLENYVTIIKCEYVWFLMIYVDDLYGNIYQ